MEIAKEPAALTDNLWEQKAIEFCARALTTAVPAQTPSFMEEPGEPKCTGEKPAILARFVGGQIFRRRDWVSCYNASLLHSQALVR